MPLLPRRVLSKSSPLHVRPQGGKATQAKKCHQLQRDKGHSNQADECTSARGRATQIRWGSPRRNAVGGSGVNAVRGGWPHDPGLCRDGLRWADAQARRPSRRRLRAGRRGGLTARMGPAADAAAEGGDHARHVLDFGEPKAWPAGRAGGQSPCGSSEDICESEDREMLLPHCGKQVGGQTMGAREAVRLSTRSLVSQAPPEPATGTSPANRPTRWRRPGP